MVEGRKKCDHPACTCLVDKDDSYCSAYCHDAADTTELACNCGHAGCGVEARQPLTRKAG